METQVEFIETAAPTFSEAACRAVSDLYGAGLRIYVMAPTEAEAIRLNNLLWTYDDQSFIPHGLWSGGEATDDPVAVGWEGGANPNGADALLLAGARPIAELLATAKLFGKVIDLVPHGDEAGKRAARERFRGFRDAGYQPVFKAGGK